jgi:hypothetical protein
LCSRGGATQEKLEKFGGQTPLGRAGQPAELGSIYVQLAAADASFATGQVYGAAAVLVSPKELDTRTLRFHPARAFCRFPLRRNPRWESSRD